MAPWSFVCPASRGIGFQLARHLLRTTSFPVVATARNKPQELKKSILGEMKDIEEKRLIVLQLDVTDEKTISEAARKTKYLFPPGENHLHLAFVIPGILYPEKSPQQLKQEQLAHTFAVNTIGPMLVAKHFSNFLPKKSMRKTVTEESDVGGKRKEWVPEQAVWLNMSARVGSTTDNKLGGWYGYRASKAGVNSLTRGLDIWAKGRSGDKAMFMSYHPGTVKTRLSRDFWESVQEKKLFSPEFAVEKMCEVVGSIGLRGRGKFWDWKGNEVLP
ncbi:hypothetical protein BGZ60DRAFT_397842 [Tricladium varicosporioides]|nr:hypothetical protein BGZ60DRAFT_397842 [Hymenoscyphus varicosporioides]